MLAIDVREACRSERAGKGQWTYGFVRELINRDVQIVLLTDSDIPDKWSAKGAKVVRFPKGLRWHFHAAKWLRSKAKNSLFVSTTSYIIPALFGKKIPCVPIVHDLIAFNQGLHNLRATCIERITLKRALKCSQHICVISENTKQDLIERYPMIHQKKISTIYAGSFSQNPVRNEPDHRTILCIGTLCPRKNQLRLIQAYSKLPRELRSQYRLLLVGASGWNDREIIRLAAQTEGVSWEGHVSDKQYEELLKSCTVFAFPSLYEGFGLPVLDALERGVPVLTSARGSLAEVAENAALTVDPESVDAIASGLKNILTDNVFREELRQRGPLQADQFSWRRTVDLFLSAVHDGNGHVEV